MSDPFVGEIRMFGFDFPPLNWALCNGQTMQIAQHQALFALLGTQFGGDGRTSFNLPDFRGRVPVHSSKNHAYTQGQVGGAENVNLNSQTMPAHTHSFIASTEAADRNGIGTQANRYLAQTVEGVTYGTPANVTPLSNIGLDPVGGSNPHYNMQPYQVINFSIALTGIFPSRP